MIYNPYSGDPERYPLLRDTSPYLVFTISRGGLNLVTSISADCDTAGLLLSGFKVYSV